MNKLFLMGVTVALLSGAAIARDKSSSIEDVVRDEIADKVSAEDEKNNRGKGRPDNPGEHGRENAAQKQAANKGKGSANHDQGILGDILEDDDAQKKDKGKDKGKNNKK